MSIIANALQKQNETREQLPLASKNKLWKVTLLVFLLIIIFLLSTLIWLISRQPPVTSLSEPQLASVAPALSVNKPVAQIITVTQKKAPLKSIDKISFVTKPLPVTLDPLSTTDPELFEETTEKLTAQTIVRTPQKKLVAVTMQESSEPSSSNATPQETPEKGVSEGAEQLKKHFQAALVAEQNNVKETGVTANAPILDIDQMELDFQRKVPTISYAFHVYSSIARDRWVRINGNDLKEGDFDPAGKLQIIEIRPNQTVFRCAGRNFILPSLKDWINL